MQKDALGCCDAGYKSVTISSSWIALITLIPTPDTDATGVTLCAPPPHPHWAVGCRVATGGTVQCC